MFSQTTGGTIGNNGAEVFLVHFLYLRGSILSVGMIVERFV